LRAGDRIRTGDVQLGKTDVTHLCQQRKPLSFQQFIDFLPWLQARAYSCFRLRNAAEFPQLSRAARKVPRNAKGAVRARSGPGWTPRPGSSGHPRVRLLRHRQGGPEGRVGQVVGEALAGASRSQASCRSRSRQPYRKGSGVTTAPRSRLARPGRPGWRPVEQGPARRLAQRLGHGLLRGGRDAAEHQQQARREGWTGQRLRFVVHLVPVGAARGGGRPRHGPEAYGADVSQRKLARARAPAPT
jgi:hypothetical protein